MRGLALRGRDEGGTVAALPRPRRRSWLRRVWARRPEPKLRAERALYPGHALLGPDDAEAVGSLLRSAVDAQRHHYRYEGRTLDMRGTLEWFPKGQSAAWLAAHHRLDVLVPFAVAAAVAPNAKARDAWYETASSHVRSWLDSVRCDRGVAGDRTVVARRVTNLLTFRECFEEPLRLDRRLRADLLRVVYEQADELAVAMAGAPADPWLIAGGRALLLAGRTFDGLEAQQWQAHGTDVLWTQLRAQVRDDGGHASGSPAWQAMVLEEYAHVAALLLAAGEDVPAWARKRLKGMCDVLWRSTHPDGSLARIGVRAPESRWTTSGLVSTVATLLGEPRLAPSGALPGAFPRLLLDERGRRLHAKLPRRSDRTESRAMRRTGLYVLGGQDGDGFIIDGGHPRRDERPFSYELSLGGLPLVVSSWDGGDAAGRLGDYATSPRAQNVVVGARRSASSPPSSLAGLDVHWMLRDGLVSFVGTDGEHRRLVLCLPGRFWLVLDELCGTGPWEGESLIHLHPQAQVDVHAHGRVLVEVTRSRSARATLAFAGATDVRLIGGLLGPRPQGWYVRGDAAAVAAQTISLSLAGPRPLCAGYAIVPRTQHQVELDVAHEPLSTCARLRIGRNVYHVSVLQDEIELHSEVL